MPSTCPNCGNRSQHLVAHNPTMFGCLQPTCRICTFFPSQD